MWGRLSRILYAEAMYKGKVVAAIARVGLMLHEDAGCISMGGICSSAH